MVNGAVVSYHARLRDALTSARARFAWGEFSVQEIERAPLQMGFLSVA